MSTITYNNKDKTPVQLGDRVTIRRFLFWKYFGTVVYVPGISPRRGDMESANYRRICIKYDNGTFDSEDADVSGVLVHSKIKFSERQNDVESLQPTDIISEEDEYRQELERNNPPMTGIRLDQTDEVTQSKLAGLPNLPDGIAWPKNDDGLEMILLAQIHCPELPPNVGLPSEGTLFFFYDLDNWDKTKVIYTKEPLPKTPRQRVIPNKGPLKKYHDTNGCCVKFAAYESHASDVFEMGESEGHHFMLGYPLWIQRDEMPPDRVLLLQIDSDTTLNPDWMWGDAGRIYFLISPSDLAAENFDNVEFEMECY